MGGGFDLPSLLALLIRVRTQSPPPFCRSQAPLLIGLYFLSRSGVEPPTGTIHPRKDRGTADIIYRHFAPLSPNIPHNFKSGRRLPK